MVPAYAKALHLIVSMIIDCLAYAFILRILLQLVKANFYNPLSQLIINITNPVITPLRRFIPNFRNLDIPSVVVSFILLALKVFLGVLILRGIIINNSGFLMLSASILFIKNVLNILTIAVFANVLFSFIPQAYNHPLAEIANKLIIPFSTRIRRVLPNMSGFDFSPLIILVLIQLVHILVIEPLSSSLIFG